MRITVMQCVASRSFGDCHRTSVAHHGNSNSTPARTSAVVVSVAKIDPEIGSYAVINLSNSWGCVK